MSCDLDKAIAVALLPSCRNLKRYMHYNSRWEAHVASQKLEGKQLQEIEQKISELEDNITELKDYTWLMQVGLQFASVLMSVLYLFFTNCVHLFLCQCCVISSPCATCASLLMSVRCLFFTTRVHLC